jgi:pyruvate-ferredoxin/flavodoxin oxidoreductase
MVILDGNEAAASVAYRLSEVVAIYPITPSSPMAEWADQWRSEGKKNIWGALPIVEELQSEGGAAGALHGALQAGAFATTFTASQGLLLMIPNMFKIAGELTPATMHVTARTLATHALSIFGDHSDVMACRSTGWAMLASNSVQEVADMALVAQIATLESRIPFIHFFDGFRTSHEVGKILPISDETIRALVDDKYIIQFRQNALSPDRPVIRGTAQNPDVFFQAREACNPFHAAVPGIVQKVMDRFAAAHWPRTITCSITYGAPDAERVIVLMGSGAEAAEEALDAAQQARRKARPPQGPPVSAPRRQRVPGRAARDRQVDCSARPHARSQAQPGEPLYQDLVTILSENSATLPFAANQRSSEDATVSLRRNSRRPWSRASSTNWPSRSRRITSPSASTTTLATPA